MYVGSKVSCSRIRYRAGLASNGKVHPSIGWDGWRQQVADFNSARMCCLCAGFVAHITRHERRKLSLGVEY